MLAWQRTLGDAFSVGCLEDQEFRCRIPAGGMYVAMVIIANVHCITLHLERLLSLSVPTQGDRTNITHTYGSGNMSDYMESPV